MSQTLSEHNAMTDSGRDSGTSLVSEVPERQPTLEDVVRDLKSIVARKDEEISRLSEPTPALQGALSKIKRLEREIQKFHEQEKSLRQQLEAKDQKIRAMKDAVKKAYEEATGSANSASSSEDDVLVLKEIPLGTGQFEQDLAIKKENTELHVDASLQGSKDAEMRDESLVRCSVDTPTISKAENMNAGNGESASDGVAETFAVRRACATGGPEAEAPPAKRCKTADPAIPLQCDECGIVYCGAQEFRRHQAQECGYPLAAEPSRQEQESVEREERPSHGSTEQTSQVQKILNQKERENQQFIARNNEKNTTNHEERPTSTPTPSEPHASDVCEQIIVVSDSDHESDTSEEIAETVVPSRSDAANGPNYSPPRTCVGEKFMGEGHPKLYYCECGMSYKSKSALNTHKNLDCGEEDRECEKCGKSMRPSSLLKHTDRKDCISKDNLRCKYCSFVAQDGRRFKIHKRFCANRKTIISRRGQFKTNEN